MGNTMKGFKCQITTMVSIGIDVSKETLEVCGLADDRAIGMTLNNTVVSIECFRDQLVYSGYAGPIIMESTGYYHWLCAVILTEMGMDVRIVNPLLASKHHRGSIRGSKTDALDAVRLAQMGVTERDLPPTWTQDRNWVISRHKVGLLCSIDKTLQKLKSSLRAHTEAIEQMELESDPMLTHWRDQIRSLEQAYRHQKQVLEAELSNQSAGAFDRVSDIGGVSRYAAGLMSLLLSKEAKSDRAWIAFTGLDIRNNESGKWRGKSKLSKRGNAYLRKVLYQTAWGLKQNNREFKQYYETHKAQGRPYVECLIMVARKFLRIAYILVTKQTQYDPNWINQCQLKTHTT